MTKNSFAYFVGMNFSGFSPNQGGLSPGFTSNVPIRNPQQSGISPTNYGKFGGGFSPNQVPTFNNTMIGLNGGSTLYQQPGQSIPSNTNLQQVSTSKDLIFVSIISIILIYH